MRKYKILALAGACLLAGLIIASGYLLAAESDDAIAVRIVPNPNHYSVFRWYESQGFAGSPQALLVDGYEAVRDGRTVYVNAANIKGKNIYTNIYLISYNQDPSPKTVDILGQIVKNWKFNTDITEKTNPGPTCAISSLPCRSDSDCASDQYCASSTPQADSCVLKTPKNCRNDQDCPANFFCDSIKAKVVRDLKRIGQTEELKEALYQYKLERSSYPKMDAGSYIPGHSVSVWPSWQSTFLPALGVSGSYVDPINRLGRCQGFDLKTCWNDSAKRFVFDPQPAYLMLPGGSYGMVYKTDANGSNYTLCAVLETKVNVPELNFQFQPNNPNSSACVTATGIITGGNAGNQAPVLASAYLEGESDMELNASLRVVDPEGNPLSWNFSAGGPNWSSWSAAPVLKGTNNSNQKKIWAQRAGAPGTYNTLLVVSDGQGGTLTTTTPIKIVNAAPTIEAENGTISLDPAVTFSYRLYFSDNNLADPATAYTVSKVSGPNNFNLLAYAQSIKPAGTNRYELTFQGNAPVGSFAPMTEYIYRIFVKDKYNAQSSKDFKITLTNDEPVLSLNCPPSQRLGKSYSCYLGQTHQGAHTIYFSGQNVPTGLDIVFSTSTGSTPNQGSGSNAASLPMRLWSKILALVRPAQAAQSIVGGITVAPKTLPEAAAYLKGIVNGMFSGLVTIKAANEHGAYTTKSFQLEINNYCGDGEKQQPNTEGRGGLYNDGYEDCDVLSGLSVNAAGIPVVSTDATKQYSCQTNAGNTPFPIPNNNYCIFKSPVEGGGYCGDGYCQAKIIVNGQGVPVETEQNCPGDCSLNCQPDCSGKACGYDGCGGICGDCAAGQSCVQNQCVSAPSYNCGQMNCSGSEICCGSVCRPNSWTQCGGSCCQPGKYCCPNGTCVANPLSCQAAND